MLDKEGQNKFGKSQLKSPFSKQLQQIAELEKNVRVIENGEQLEFLYDELGLDALITILSGAKQLQQIAELEKNVRVIENGEQLEFLYDELGLDALITILSGGKK
jgi:proline dehydrogenase